MAENDKRLEDWARKQLFKEQCDRFVLRHITASSGKLGSEVADFESPDDGEESSLAALITEFMVAAETDAIGIGGVQRYVLHSFVNGSKKHKARYTFRMQGDDESDGIDSEPATPAGLVTQLMRHLEVTQRLGVQQQTVMANNTSQQLREQGKIISEMYEDRHKNWELVQALTSMQHERDIETLEAESKQKLLSDAFDKVSLLAPSVINKLSGQKLLPEKHSPNELAITELLASMSAEQITALQSILNPEQAIALAMLAQSLGGDNGNENPEP